MRTRDIVLSVTAVLFTAGCQSWDRPNAESRQQAAAQGAADLAPQVQRIKQSGFHLITCAREVAFDFVAQPTGFDLAWHATDGRPVVFGLATAISADGYLLTAVHLIKEHCYVAGWLDRGVALVPARLVATAVSTEFGGEVAVLHMRERPEQWAEFGELPTTDQQIYCLARESQPALHTVIFAGRILDDARPPTGGNLAVLATTLPIWRGDSGGGVFSLQGRLVGVATGATKPWLATRVARLVAMPDQRFLRSLIAADRSETNRAPPRAAATESPAPR